MDFIAFGSDDLRCSVNPLGAELSSLSDREGRDWLWDGDPTWWTGRAPILFPIVGMLRDGRYRHDGREYELEKHGFARRSRFQLVERHPESVLLRLEPDDLIRAVYPFDFQLDLRFAAHGRNLSINAGVINRGDRPMPFSFGFHPALRWPLPGGRRDGAALRFDRDVPGPVWRMNGEGLIDRSEPSPIRSGVLALDDKLFRADAMILRDVASHGVTFDCGSAQARVSWDNLPDLGIWTKPDAPYLCIEPWQGFNDPAGFDGELSDKPGTVVLPPGEAWAARMTISV